MKKLKLTAPQKENVKELSNLVKRVEEENKQRLNIANTNLNVYVQAILDGKELDASLYEFNEDRDLILKEQKEEQKEEQKNKNNKKSNNIIT